MHLPPCAIITPTSEEKPIIIVCLFVCLFGLFACLFVESIAVYIDSPLGILIRRYSPPGILHCDTWIIRSGKMEPEANRDGEVRNPYFSISRAFEDLVAVVDMGPPTSQEVVRSQSSEQVTVISRPRLISRTVSYASSSSSSSSSSSESEIEFSAESIEKRARLVRRTVRSLARLVALSGNNYDTTDHVLQDLSMLEQWTDEVDELRPEVATADGISIFLNLFRVFPKNSGISVKVCNIITFVARNERCCAEISSHGAIPAIIDVMKRHRAHSQLQAQACNALNNLAMRDDNRQRIAQAMGIPIIFKAMEQFPDSTEVQANGCNCLWNLAISPRNRPLVAEGLNLLLKAMVNHKRNSSLLGEGCGCLWNLADYTPARTRILNLNGINVIFDALEMHPHQDVMHRLCLGALESLLNDDDTGRVLLWKRPNAIEVLLQSMRSNWDDEDIQSAGCGILASLACADLMNLAISTPFGLVLHQHGAIPLILEALWRHGSCSKVQGRGCSAILYLAYNEKVRQALLDTNARALIQKALFDHVSDPTVFGTALMALSQLTTTPKLEERAVAA